MNTSKQIDPIGNLFCLQKCFVWDVEAKFRLSLNLICDYSVDVKNIILSYRKLALFMLKCHLYGSCKLCFTHCHFYQNYQCKINRPEIRIFLFILLKTSDKLRIRAWLIRIDQWTTKCCVKMDHIYTLKARNILQWLSIDFQVCTKVTSRSVLKLIIWLDNWNDFCLWISILQYCNHIFSPYWSSTLLYCCKLAVKSVN